MMSILVKGDDVRRKTKARSQWVKETDKVDYYSLNSAALINKNFGLDKNGKMYSKMSKTSYMLRHKAVHNARFIIIYF